MYSIVRLIILFHGVLYRNAISYTVIGMYSQSKKQDRNRQKNRNRDRDRDEDSTKMINFIEYE